MMLTRVRVTDIVPYEGSQSDLYMRAVEALNGSLTRHNAAIIELATEEAAIMRCGLEATRSHFRAREQLGCNGEATTYRAGKTSDDSDSSPPCMAEVYRIMGKAARAALSAVSKYLHLRSDVFDHLLDDTPLSANVISSSFLVAAYSHHDKGTVGGRKLVGNSEVEKGFLTLISSDLPGIQVCDPNGRWYVADCNSVPGDLLLITGKTLSHVTGGLRPAALYRVVHEFLMDDDGVGRSSLLFKLMPQGNAMLDCSSVAAVGHVIPQSYVPVSVSQFMSDHFPSDDLACNHPYDTHIDRGSLMKGQPLRSVLSDPLSGAFLEDAVVVSCGHSFGGLMLERVIEMRRCATCSEEIDTASLIPNIALRSAAAFVKHEDERRLCHSATIRKRRKELGDQTDIGKSTSWGNAEAVDSDNSHRAVQYPFSVHEKVLIVGNRRTPEKFFGKEAIITSQCLNGWYLLKIIGTDESVRLQYRSLRKLMNPQPTQVHCTASHPNASSLP